MNEESARSLELFAEVQARQASLEAESSQMQRHSKSLIAFHKLEESRQKLNDLKRKHLLREVAFHSKHEQESGERLLSYTATRESRQEELRIAQAAASELDAESKAGDAAKAQARTGQLTAERQLAKVKEECTRLTLSLKQHTAAEGRASKVGAKK